jgi:hypothetical protein
MNHGDPFEVAHSYRVIKSFKALRDTFVEGEVLEYRERVYSRYDGCAGFIFLDPEKKTRVWDLHDDDSVEVWSKLFEDLK